MPARTLPDRFSFFTPGMLNPRPVALRAQGICTQPLQAAACSGVSGASEAPKSTVLAVIWAIPEPEPTAPKLTLTLPWPAASKPLAQLASSGATSVEPAPVRFAEAAAVERVVMHPTIPVTAMRKPNNLLRIKRDSFRLVY